MTADIHRLQCVYKKDETTNFNPTENTMSKFFRIHSSNENVSVQDMFTLGCSTSRGTEAIGQFGSGCLMSALTWLRLFGISPIFFVNGEKITFSFKPRSMSDGEVSNEVFIHSGAKKGVPLSVSLEYGMKDWTDAGMALREWVSNVLDQGEDIRDDKVICLSNTARKTDAGVTVYVPINSDVMTYWSQISDNFLQFTDRGEEKIIHKRSLSPMKVYRRGVLIREFPQYSMFDYNMDFDISESRNGSSDSMIDRILSYMSMSATAHESERILQSAIDGVQCFETEWENWRSPISEIWTTTVKQRTEIFAPKNAGEGCLPGSVLVPHKWYEYIIALDPKKDGLVKSSAAMRDGFKILPPSQEMKDNLDKVWEMFELLDVLKGKKRPAIEQFESADGCEPSCYGLYDNDTVSIYKQNHGSLNVMLEEVCHHVSGKSDMTRGFQTFILKSMADMIESF